ncbi:peroxidasin homolog pxn-1-like isoform X2 [Mercenaria mercenaria]|uniref:peroxidasin homolog pxn-1-like isoform X2 n=1 Tax=Mercenaria mercenaria TaxID=6596 RepID=UPI00234E4541|nr:peroxidasin homolog pxn-1-like isoform X2 [Mercenaria mercenaria]
MQASLVILLAIAALHVADTYASAELDTGLRQRTPSVREVEAAVEKAREINLLKRGINSIERNYTGRSVSRCPLSLHHGTRQLSDAKISTRANDALLAVRTLMIDGGYSLADLQHDSVRDVFKRVNGLSCDVPRPSNCDFKSKYRNADGSCNNRRNPEWGMAGSVQRRVLSNDYVEENCCDTNLRGDIDKCFNIIMPQFGLEFSSSIFVPGYCMEVRRSAPVFCPDATSNGVSLRQQTTSLTSFVDASNVYGSSASRQEELRENENGYRLKTAIFGNQERLPNGPSDTCTLTNSSQDCSAAGDGRVNEVPTLTSYHFLFVKEHNRIADTIKEFYDNDETIFQETRRILIAIMQKIVYDEFLPSFFSQKGLSEYKLQSSANYVYNPDTDPTMLNAFGIAYRVGHSWISQRMRLFSRSLTLIHTPGFTRKTENTFNNPDMTYLPNGFERLAYYLSGTQSPETDSIIEEAVRSRLFLDTDNNIAFDLAALNIQRGRDHGLPSYNKYRKWCGLSSVGRKWAYDGNSGLIDHTYRARQMLKGAGYKSPRDIDLFVGGLTETPLSGGNLGPTFECIIGRQFQRLKFGDRLWYQNKDAGFTNDQIAAIQGYSLSKVLCNNYNFEKVHFPSAFESRSPGGGNGGYQGSWWNSGNWGNSGNWTDWGNYNPSNYWYDDIGTNGRTTLTSCGDIPDLDLSAFEPKFYKKTMETDELENNVDIKEKLERMLDEIGKI